MSSYLTEDVLFDDIKLCIENNYYFEKNIFRTEIEKKGLIVMDYLGGLKYNKLIMF